MVGLLDANESRPAGNEAAIKNTGGRSETSLGDVAGLLHRADYALLVVSGLRNGGTRRSFYFSLPSALKAMDRAASRGVTASITLVKFTPTGHVDLDSIGGAR